MLPKSLIKSFLPMLEPAIEKLIETADSVDLQEGESQPAMLLVKDPETGKAMLKIVALNEQGKIARIIGQGELVPTIETLING